MDAALEGVDALFDAVLRGGDELGGGGGGGGAEVGDEVGDGEVGLVADGGDDGELRGGDGAGEGLVVEAGEVFEGASAAGDEDEVDVVMPGGWRLNQRMPAATLAGQLRALHDGGVDEEVEAGVAAADDGDDVADDGAGGRGDDADAAREGGRGRLRAAVEEAFGEEAVALSCSKASWRAPAPRGSQGFGDELELAAGLVDGDAAADHDGEAVAWAEAEELAPGGGRGRRGAGRRHP